MYAIVSTGGKQYKVAQGDVIDVEKLDAQPGDKVELDVLMLNDGATSSYRRTKGHRQNLAKLKIVELPVEAAAATASTEDAE